MQEFDLKISPSRKLIGEIKIPGDKSITHRAIIISAISNAKVLIENWLQSEDCIATLNAVNSLGIKYKILENNILQIQGKGLYGLEKPKNILDLGNSGTGIRLLSGVLAAQRFETILTGDDSLKKRPMQRIIEPLMKMGANIKAIDNNFAPLTIYPVKQLKNIIYKLPVASAQVKSGVLLAGLYTDEITKVIDNFNCRNHTELMLDYMKPYLVDMCYFLSKNEKKNIYSDNENKLLTIEVPSDISSAAFFIVAALIIPGSDLIIKNVGINPTRTGAIDILKAMGAYIKIYDKKTINNELRATLRIKYSKLRGIKVGHEIVPRAIDEFPILFVAAAYAEGETIFSGLEELKVKESDRLSVMAEGLKSLGIRVCEFEDGIKIFGGKINSGLINSYFDHRVAMAFVIGALQAKGSIIIKNCANISTSFPKFFELCKSININIKKIT